VLFLLADSTTGCRCIEAISAHDVVVTAALQIIVHASPFSAGVPVIGWPGSTALRQGTGSTQVVLGCGDHIVAGMSGHFTVFHAESRTGGRIASTSPADRAAVGLEDLGPLTAPIDVTLGARLIERGERTVAFAVDARPGLGNERGGMRGGVGALIGERACAELSRLVAPLSMTYEPVELRAAFFRPIPADGSNVRCIARVERLGRRLAATQSVLLIAPGAPAVVVDVLAAGVAGTGGS
jgi:acyl-coenzyme A thioesterase PaaI-like protein